jgi:transcriptional regulator with XRE-family HTH domain
MDTAYDPLWLDREMKRCGIRTGRLAELSKVSRSQIQRIRNGAPPRMDTLAALQAGLRAAGVTTSEKVAA